MSKWWYSFVWTFSPWNVLEFSPPVLGYLVKKGLVKGGGGGHGYPRTPHGYAFAISIIFIIMMMIMMITVVLKFLFFYQVWKHFKEMKKYMTISLLCFLFVAIAIPGMEAKPLKAVNIECFIHMIKMWLRHYLRHKDDKFVLNVLWNESSSETAHFLFFYVFVCFCFGLVCVVCVCVLRPCFFLLFIVVVSTICKFWRC